MPLLVQKGSTRRLIALSKISTTLPRPQSNGVKLIKIVLTCSEICESKCKSKVRARRALDDIIIVQEADSGSLNSPWKDNRPINKGDQEEHLIETHQGGHYVFSSMCRRKQKTGTEV